MVALRAVTSDPGPEAGSAPERDTGPAVLVADDDDWVRERVSESLRAHGFRVTSVKDGRTLCALIDAWAAGTSGPYSLVISDLSMPGASGLEALERLRGAGIAVPFLLMSGFVGEEEGAAARGLGVTMILDKPFDLSSLPATVRAVTSGPFFREE